MHIICIFYFFYEHYALYLTYNLLIPHIIIIQHVDRYLRLKRQKTLNTKTPGVAIIEYEDGETEMVNLRIETFRNYREDDEEKQRNDNDSDTNNNRQVNNFDLITKGEMIEILWPLADMYFPCKIVSYIKLLKGDSSKKRSRKTVDEVKEDDDSKIESIPKKKKQLELLFTEMKVLNHTVIIIVLRNLVTVLNLLKKQDLVLVR